MQLLIVFLFARWKDLARWRNLWSILIFLLGTAFSIFLIAAVFLFIRESWIPSVLSTLGTIVNGVAVGWILARRNQAVEEETEAKKELIQNCGTGVAAAVKGFARTGETKTIEDAIEEVERQLRLIGTLR